MVPAKQPRLFFSIAIDDKILEMSMNAAGWWI